MFCMMAVASARKADSLLKSVCCHSRKLTQTARISCAAAGDGVGAAESTGLADGCGVVDGPNTAGIMKRNDIRKNTPKVDKNMRMIPPLCRFAIHPSICAENERQYRIILSADTASEVRQMPSQKRR